MNQTSAAAAILALARDLGAVPYDVTSGDPVTSKLTRLRLPDGRPVVIQNNNKVPRIWMLPEHDAGALGFLGKREHYEAGRGRHSNLDQVREFKGRALVKIEVLDANWNAIQVGLSAVGALRTAA